MTTQIDTEKDTTDREIVASRVFDAPRELVWEAMANPDHVVNWWGPRGFTTTVEVMDLCPGGIWKHVMHGPDGTEYPNQSIFTEVVKPERIVFVNSGGKAGAPGVQFSSTWSFDALDARKTRVTIRMVFETSEARDKVARTTAPSRAPTKTLARLGEFLAPGSVVIERFFDAPTDKVWRAITEPEQIQQWFAVTIREFKAEVGFETQVVTECGDLLWKVTEVAPGSKIAYSWKYPDGNGSSDVSWELFGESGKTRLRLVHTGLDTFDTTAYPKRKREGFFGGWTHFTGKLKEFVEKGK